MELIKKNIHMMVNDRKEMTQITLDDDMNVPDNRPDMINLIQQKGDIVLEEVKANENQAWIKGNLNFLVMYISDNEERRIQSIEGKIPFEEYVHMEGLKAGEQIRAEGELEDLRIGIINSRKMSTQAVVTLQVTTEEMLEEEISVDIAEKNGIEFWKNPMEIMELRINTKDMLRIKEEIALPNGKNNIHEIVWKDAALNIKEIKLLPGKINVCGTVKIFVLYRGEGDENKLDWVNEEVAFTKELECSGCSEGMVPDIRSRMRSCDMEMKADYDGEERIIALDAVLDMDVKIYEEEQVELVEDVYSTAMELQPQTTPLRFQRLVGNNMSKCRISDRMRIKGEEPRILQICNGSGKARIDMVETGANGVMIEGTLEVMVLYVGADDNIPFYGKMIQIPFNQQIDMNDIKENTVYKVEVGTLQINTTMIDSEEIEIKAVIDMSVMAVDEFEKDVIHEIAEAPLDYERLENIAGIVVYVVAEGDSLWSIGKKYLLGVEEIKELNHLESNVLKKGDRLILCKNISTPA
jgi:LysM repeat protein